MLSKALKLGSDLSRAQKEFKDKQRWSKSQISQLTQQVENAVEAKERLETDLDKLQHKFELSLDEQKGQLQKELQVRQWQKCLAQGSKIKKKVTCP